MVAQVGKEISALYGNRNLVSAFTRIRCWAVSEINRYTNTEKKASHFLIYWLLQWRFVSLTCVRNNPVLAVHGCLYNIPATALSWRSTSRKNVGAPPPSDKDPIYFLFLFPSFAARPQSEVLRSFASVMCFMHIDKPKHTDLKKGKLLKIQETIIISV